MTSSIRAPLARELARCPRTLLSIHTPGSSFLQSSTRRCAHRFLHTSPATSAESPKKQQITVSSGDPSTKQWKDLSGPQKVVRTATTGASAATVAVGLVVTVTVLGLVYFEVMAPDSVTAWFNRSHDRVKNDPDCIRLLGDGRIKAYGEPTYNRWAKARPIAAKVTKDRNGTEHLLIHFNVEGNLERGVVYAHLVKRPSESEHVYKYLRLDVPGHQSIHLVKNEAADKGGSKRGFLGVKWA